MNGISFTVLITLPFYNYPTTVPYNYAYLLTLYGIYSTVKPFDPPMQNTTTSYISVFFVIADTICFNGPDHDLTMSNQNDTLYLRARRQLCAQGGTVVARRQPNVSHQLWLIHKSLY